MGVVLALFGVSAPLVLCACAPDSGPTGSAAALTGASVEAGFDEVLLLRSGEPPTPKCSSVLITPQTVLTAAHCVETPPIELETPAGERIAPREVVMHPAYDPERPWEHDLALLHLAEPIELRPASLAVYAPAVGDALRLVGFGRTALGADDEGVKRSGETSVRSVEPGYLETFDATGASGCVGDSGGPLYDTGRGEGAVVGIMSWLPMLRSRGCDSSLWSVRIDEEVDWIADQAIGVVSFVSRLDAPDAGVSVDAATIDSAPDASNAAPAGGCGVHRESPGGGWAFFLALVVSLRGSARRRASRACAPTTGV